jgi:hypothetical protein
MLKKPPLMLEKYTVIFVPSVAKPIIFGTNPPQCFYIILFSHEIIPQKNKVFIEGILKSIKTFRKQFMHCKNRHEVSKKLDFFPKKF